MIPYKREAIRLTTAKPKLRIPIVEPLERAEERKTQKMVNSSEAIAPSISEQTPLNTKIVRKVEELLKDVETKNAFNQTIQSYKRMENFSATRVFLQLCQNENIIPQT